MKNITALNRVSAAVSRKGLVLQKASPNLLFGAGVVGVVATVVLASRATLRLSDILDTTEENIAYTKEHNHPGVKRDMARVYVRSGGQMLALYAPALVVGSLSISALTGAHVTLNRRNASSMAAYAALDKAFRNYRGRVQEDLGEEKEQEFYRGVEKVDLHVPEGTKIVKDTLDLPGGYSPYAQLFDPRNVNWSPTAEYNLYFLRAQQNYWNVQLNSKGHVFLNEVYDSLGLERTKAGAVVGWIKGEGDDHVDFGIYNEESMTRMHEFMVGQEASIWLDFNVDGIIYDKI